MPFLLEFLTPSYGYFPFCFVIPALQLCFHTNPVCPFFCVVPPPPGSPVDLRVCEHTEREQEALRAALDAQRAQHERQLEAELAARDAEALEALRLLDSQHRRGDFGRHTAVDAVNGGRGGHGDSPPPPSMKALASVPAQNRRREPSTKTPAAATAVVAAIRSAAAARAEALREATEESHRLEAAMSPSVSPVRGDPGHRYVAAPPRPVPKKAGMLVAGDGNADGSNSPGLSQDDGDGGGRYLSEQHGGEAVGAPGGGGTPRSGRPRRREASAGVESGAAAHVVGLSPPSFPGVAATAAPAWTVGDGRGGGDDLAAVVRVSADASGGGGGSGGETGFREPEMGGADDTDPGLTVRRVCVGRHELRP